MGVDDHEQVEVTSRAAWRAWLAEHHDRREGIWLVTYKKHCGERHLSWPEIVREAICFGWIDSRARGVDADRTSVLVTPRRPGSHWSAINKHLVAELEAEDLLAPPGLAVIEAARADGSWTWLDEIEALVVPPDLAGALARAGLEAAWDATAPSQRKQVLFALKSAKRPPTRAARLAQAVDDLGRR